MFRQEFNCGDPTGLADWVHNALNWVMSPRTEMMMMQEGKADEKIKNLLQEVNFLAKKFKNSTRLYRAEVNISRI